MTHDELRADQLRANLDAARERIARAAASAGRSDPVDLVVVTKTFPASDVHILAQLGVTEVGENRDQEARAKRREVESLGDVSLRWHMIGRLQSNKAASVTSWADVVESVDRQSLVTRLAKAAEDSRKEGEDQEGRAPLDVFIQVSLDEPVQPNRGGANPKDVAAIAQAVHAAEPALRLAGVMAVAPHPDTGIDPALAFARLAEVAEEIHARWPHARVISAGMSTDLEAAVAAGATQVRIGGAILGQRPVVQ